MRWGGGCLFVQGVDVSLSLKSHGHRFLRGVFFAIALIAAGIFLIQSQRVIAQEPTDNNEATGTPTFIGTFRVGEVLRIDTSSIDDLDGLTDPDFSYTWLADDDLVEPGSYLRGYSFRNEREIAPYDFGMTIKVQVHFDDDLGNDEVIEMQAATTVAAAPPDSPGDLSASLGDPGELDLSWSSPAVCDYSVLFDCWLTLERTFRVADGGSDITGYTVQWKLSTGDWSVASDVSEAEVTGTSYTVTGLAASNSYTVRVRAENVAGLGTPSTEVTVSGTDLNVGPVVSGRAVPSFFETSPKNVWTYTVADPESDAVTWSLSGDDAQFFSIADGVLNFDTAGDFEDPQDVGANNAYDLNVLASDGDNTATFSVTVIVIDVEDERPVITGDDDLTFAEYTATTTVLQTYSATDPEGVSSSFTWSLAGVDSDDFEISSTGALSFKDTLDYEHPDDSDGDNIYNFQVRAEDATKTGRLDVTVTVTNVNEAPSTPTGNAAITVAENTTQNLASYTATDPDEDDTVTWGVSGIDASTFRIDSLGNLAFHGIPDYEEPGDSDSNNVYEVSVDAEDSEFTSSLAITVTVTPVDEPPIITGTSIFDNWQENDTSTIHIYIATDPEGNTPITWNLGGADSDDFEITGTGTLSFKDAPDYEHPADSGGDNHYEVAVQATDSNGNQGQLHVDITVKDVNELPASPPGSDECTYDLGTLVATVTQGGAWAEDCESSVSGRGYARYYSFTLIGSAEVTIDLESSVDTYLYLREGSATSGTALHSNDDVESGNLNSRIVATLSAGSYTIEATTYAEGATGSFTLSVSGAGGGQTPVATGCDPASLSLPASGVSGAWAEDCESSVSGRGYARYYSFTLIGSAEVTIDLESSVDTYLYLREGSATSGTALHSNDDVESGNLNSRIVATPSRPPPTLSAGSYTIEATTYAEGATGSFTLSVSGAGGGQTPVATGCDPASLSLPASGVAGTWSDDCESSVSGRGYARYYSFTLSESAEVTIDLESSVDTYLYLREGSATSGTALHSNDDIENGNLNSRIVATLSAGSYTIEATTYAEATSGSFTLRVSGAGGGHTPVATGCDPASLSLPASGVSGAWSDDCESSVSGRGYARYYSFTLSESAEVTIDLESSVDTYLYLREGSATSGTARHSNDDIENGNLNSRIVATLSAGTWTIEATTYSEGTTGSFTLSVSGENS